MAISSTWSTGMSSPIERRIADFDIEHRVVDFEDRIVDRRIVESLNRLRVVDRRSIGSSTSNRRSSNHRNGASCTRSWENPASLNLLM
eukprot:6125774-Pyramimonas_sp.AAC.1